LARLICSSRFDCVVEYIDMNTDLFVKYVLLPFIGYLVSLTDAEYARDEAHFTRSIEQVSRLQRQLDPTGDLADTAQCPAAELELLRVGDLRRSHGEGQITQPESVSAPAELTIVGEGHGPIEQDGLLSMLSSSGDLSTRAKELFFVVHKALSLFQQGKFTDCLRVCAESGGGPPVPEVLVCVEAAALLMLGMRKDARTSLEKMCTEQQLRADGQRAPEDWTEADVVYFVRLVIAQKDTWSFNC
jgi:hypothetical protein